MAEEFCDDLEGEEVLRELELEEAAERSQVRDAVPLPPPCQVVASSRSGARLQLGAARPIYDSDDDVEGQEALRDLELAEAATCGGPHAGAPCGPAASRAALRWSSAGPSSASVQAAALASRPDGDVEQHDTVCVPEPDLGEDTLWEWSEEFACAPTTPPGQAPSPPTDMAASGMLEPAPPAPATVARGEPSFPADELPAPDSAQPAMPI